MSEEQQPEWWRHAVIYQVYVRSFADGDGDGVGDLPGITARLPHLVDLGVDALWITPFYPSPQHDHGYDVADYRGVDPLFGSLDDADALLERAHALGLRVVVDLVPNHTSEDHAWFRAALAAEPGSPERGRYLFRDGRGPDGAEPPNNWQSVFGGPSWSRVDDGQWYLHLFDSSQPDLDWRNPEIGDEFASVLRFWLDRGVDGFRVDVAHGLYKEESLRDQELPASAAGRSVDEVRQEAMVERTAIDEPMWDQPEVHDVYRRWRGILDSYDGDRMDVAEAWTQTPASMARFVRSDEMNQTFNFAWLLAPWSAEAFAEVVRSTFAALEDVHADPTWVLSNHDVVRHPSRYAALADGTVDPAVGLARSRAATLTMLALPGSSYLYQGEELGLPEVDVPPEARQDPAWTRGYDDGPGRDGCRVPIPWSGDAPPYGFGPGAGQPWLPQPAGWASLTVEAQRADPTSTYSFYRRALAARRALPPASAVEIEVDGDELRLHRPGLTVALNCGATDAPLPMGEVVVASGHVDAVLPPHTAVWVEPRHH